MDEAGLIRRTVLPSGTRVITEKMAGTRAVSIGMWLPRGSRDEDAQALGSTHFLEHLLFKGTTRRDAKELAQVFDEVGGDFNAATAKEYTHYYAELLGEDLDRAVDCLMDMVTAPLLEPQTFELERGVIVDELMMALDSANEQAFDSFAAKLFAGHPLGRPIGGTVQTVSELGLEALHHHYQSGYTPDQLVVAAAGDVDHRRVCDLVMAALDRGDSPWSQWRVSQSAPPRDFSLQVSAPISGFPVPSRGEAADSVSGSRGEAAVPGAGEVQFSPSYGSFDEAGNYEQTQILVGGPGLRAGDEQEYVMVVLKTVLGGGMSSRLFQHIREDRGLAYQVYPFGISYRDCGQFGVAAGCNPSNAAEVAALLRAELEDIGTNLVSEEELARVKGQMRGSTLLAMEDNSARMARLAAAEIIRGEFASTEYRMARLEAVTPAEILELGAWLAENARLELRLGPRV